MFLFIVIILIVTINYTHQYKLDIDCINGNNNGINYKGTVNTTATGRLCLVWKNAHFNNGYYNYDHNYCRNPDNSTVPWCYTDITGHSRQNCNITYCGYLCPDLNPTPHMVEPMNLDKHRKVKTVTFRCAAGYLLSGHKTATCIYVSPNSMASWTNPQPTCIQDCIKSITDLNYKGHISTTRHGYTCRYWKDIGPYRTEEENYCRTPRGDPDNTGGPWCYASGHNIPWDRCNIPACPGKSCPNLTNHLIPQDRKSIYHYGETVYLSCEAGYHMKGDKIISCKQSGQWNATLPICEEIICTRMSLHLTDGMHVIQDLHRYNIKEMVTMSCKSGFIGTTVRAQCIGLNKWSHIPPICTMITCTHISLHLTRSVNVTNGKQSYDFNEEVSMSCKSGFSGKTVTARCTDVNKWSDSSPTCTIASCPNLNLTPHLSQPRTLEGYHHKDEIHFGCDVGYYLVGSLVLSCLASGRWSSQQPTCKAAPCPALPQIHQLHHIPDLSEYIYNDTVTFQCDVGFLLSGPASITCITNNRQSPVYWSGKQPSCTAIACPGLYEGYSIKWSPNHTSYSYNDIVHFQCDVGYQLSGPSSLVCQADGNESIGYWSNKQPACVEEYKGVSYLVFGIVVALIIVVAVGVNIGLILLMRIKLKDSSKQYEDIKITMGQLRNDNEDQTYSELSDTQQ